MAHQLTSPTQTILTSELHKCQHLLCAITTTSSTKTKSTRVCIDNAIAILIGIGLVIEEMEGIKLRSNLVMIKMGAHTMHGNNDYCHGLSNQQSYYSGILDPLSRLTHRITTTKISLINDKIFMTGLKVILALFLTRNGAMYPSQQFMVF